MIVRATATAPQQEEKKYFTVPRDVQPWPLLRFVFQLSQGSQHTRLRLPHLKNSRFIFPLNLS
jgi:hypothetical protein